MVVDHSIRPPRADIILRRPEVLNAMDRDVFEELARAADAVAAAEDVRVCVVSGEGRSFCSGIDVDGFASGRAMGPQAIAVAQSGFRRIAALPMPTVAAVRGHALGAGLQLALACDLRVVAADAVLGLLEANFGLVPDLGGTQQLPLLVGPARAKSMIWLAERIDGEEAGHRGLAELVVDERRLDTAVSDLAALLAATPPTAARAVKRLVGVAGQVSIDEGMDREAAAQMKQFASGDFAEAMSRLMSERG